MRLNSKGAKNSEFIRHRKELRQLSAWNLELSA
jgi:hypothetical protein